jgi:hypothetical protein
VKNADGRQLQQAWSALMDSDGDLLKKVNEVDDFFGSVFFKDSLDDWNLASDFGEFLLRNGPVVMGHALLARAQRHLGNNERARDELKRCKVRVANGELAPGEVEMFARLLAEEDQLLNRSPK